MTSAATWSRTLLRDLVNGILDLVYPPFCLVCNAAGSEYLCAKCIESIDLIEQPYCHKCGIPVEASQYYCRDCREREFAFQSASAAGIYDGVLRDAIHALKYGPHIAMADPLARLMAKCFHASIPIENIDAVVPVPIHNSRLIERGFNQAEELARGFCRMRSLPLLTGTLAKPRRTKHQVDLSQEERIHNLSGAFSVKRPDLVAGKRILLIDDVLTTGSTAHEAARALRSSGAQAIYVYTLARSA